MRRRSSRLVKLAIHAAVICAFLAAEALAFAHSLDADAHSNDEPCKICVSIGGLGGATVAKAELHPPADGAPILPPAGRIAVESRAGEAPPARGPPR